MTYVLIEEDPPLFERVLDQEARPCANQNRKHEWETRGDADHELLRSEIGQARHGCKEDVPREDDVRRDEFIRAFICSDHRVRARGHEALTPINAMMRP